MGNSSVQTHTLIVGAGPPGLMMACQLALRGVPFRIIDKGENPFRGSGALVLHARTLEFFNQMGIAEKAIHQGIRVNKINVVFNGRKPLTLGIKSMGQEQTGFPGLLLLEQARTEQLLIDFLHSYGHCVERNTEITGFSLNDESCTNSIRLPDGTNIPVKSKFIIAADGGHSFIREGLKIPFMGKSYGLSLFVYDGKADFDLPPDEICFSFSERSSAGIFPLGDGRWRVDGTIPQDLSSKAEIVFEDIEPQFASQNRLKIKLHDPEWFSVFHSHQQFAGAFKYKRCFMIGDAAHVFSPVGAQGMNTGIQDACNLAWKLAMIEQGHANESLLKSYQNERQILAKNMVKSTDKVFRIASGTKKSEKKIRLRVVPFLFKIFIPILQRHNGISRFVFNGISEIAVNYRNGPLTPHGFQGLFAINTPRAGERLPYLIFNFRDNTVNIQDLVNGKFFHLFLFSHNSFPDEFLAYTLKFNGWLNTHFIPFDSGTRPLYKRLGIRRNGCLLVRPDLYIAFISKKLVIRNFDEYLNQLSIITPVINRDNN